jgi:hypothetical protein
MQRPRRLALGWSSSRRHALNVWAFKFLQCARFRWPYETTGPQAAEYVVGPDLFVECLDRPMPERVVRHLLADGEMKAEWRRPPNRKPPNQALHLTAAPGSVFGVQGHASRRGR